MAWKYVWMMVVTLLYFTDGKLNTKWKGMKPTCAIKTVNIPIEKDGCRSEGRKATFKV